MSLALSRRTGSGLTWDSLKEELLLLCVRWHLVDSLNYGQLKNRLQQRGLSLDSSTFSYLVKTYSAKITPYSSNNLKNKPWYLKQKYIASSSQNPYLYLAVSEEGNLLDFFLTNLPRRQKAIKFFKRNLESQYSGREICDKRFNPWLKNLLFSTSITGLSLMSILLLAQTIFSKNFGESNRKYQPVMQGEINFPYQGRKPIPDKTALNSLFPYEKAFLDTIAWAEGTLHREGYKTQFGGKIINDLSEHPNQCIEFESENKRSCSTAFGRYQILDFNAKEMSFTPENQDQWAMQKLEEIGALAALRQGDIEGAIIRACQTWVTLPCHRNTSLNDGDKQRKSMDDLLAKYEERYQLY